MLFLPFSVNQQQQKYTQSNQEDHHLIKKVYIRFF
jgi:hypothetical protein